MNSIEQHISRLLLSNDCVIIPDFGGFITHYAEARFSAEDGLFFPPRREIGFNRNLTMNDSLLAQDYVEVYDISYPEALRRIEKNVEELRQSLNTVGCYVFNGIGTIMLNEDGQYEFKPFAAGIITPDYYALSAFEIKQIEEKAVPVVAMIPEDEKEISNDTEEEKNGKVTLSVRMIRNAVAAVVAAMIFLLSPISLNDNSRPMTSSVMSNITALSKIAKETTNEVKEIAQQTFRQKSMQAEENSSGEIAEEPTAYFTIVLASRVSEKNATRYAGELTARGMKETVAVLKNIESRVVFGHYATQGEAYSVRNRLARQAEFKDCWVMEVR